MMIHVISKFKDFRPSKYLSFKDDQTDEATDRYRKLKLVYPECVMINCPEERAEYLLFARDGSFTVSPPEPRPKQIRIRPEEIIIEIMGQQAYDDAVAAITARKNSS